MDKFREESVNKVKSGFSNFIYILSFIGMAIFGIMAILQFSALMNGFFELPIIVSVLIYGGLAYGCFVARNSQRIEYDYTFTNGTLDIAKIINNSRRKKLLSADVSKFEIIAPISDEGFQRALNNRDIKKRFNYFLNRGGLYYGIFQYEGKKALLVFEPSETMVQMFRSYNPRNIKVK